MQDYRIASQESLMMTLIAQNNMPPRRSSATARAAAAAARAAAAAAALMTAAAGTEGVVVLSQWFKKIDSVFHISNCAMENQVKFTTCTFLGNALTWWNSHMKTVTRDVAYAIGLELALMCGRMFHEESKEVEKYVGGLPDMIRGNVMSYQPKTMEKAIEFSNDQMDQKVLTITERQAERALHAGPGEKREYTRSLPLCTNATITTKVHVLQGHFKKDADAEELNAGINVGIGHALAWFMCSLIDITPTTLDHYYDVELADGKIIGINTIIVRISWGNETLIVHGDKSNQGNETRLNIILCTKTHKYLLKGHNVFLAHVTTKETEDKSGEKRLEDVPIVQDFPEVFPEDLPGLPPTRQVEFQIDLMPGATLVARAPYRLAPSKMKELSEQL
ncbi:hypothetical protein Tco_0864020 [Tanacetum coccineum]